MKITPLQIREVFGNVAPPKRIWEKQFDDFDAELAEIGQKEWQCITEGDLWYYLHDLSYMELQPDLFAHLFPVCLNFWYDSLMRNEGASRGDADFHLSLRRGQILTKMVTLEQREFVYEFMRNGLIDRIEKERGFRYTGRSAPAYGWMFRFNSLGIIAPIVDRIWESWWQLDHPGKAVCAVMWASGLVYEQWENPLFGAFGALNETHGGGGPYLVSNDTEIYDAGWMPHNLNFLRSTLNVDYIQTKLALAAAALQGEPEQPVALEVASQARERPELIESRMAALFQGLNTTVEEWLADSELRQLEIW